MTDETKIPAMKPVDTPAEKPETTKSVAAKPRKKKTTGKAAPKADAKPKEPAAPAVPKADELADLKKMVQRLTGNVETLANRLEAKEIENLELKESVAEMKLGLEEREADGELIERDGDVLYDPFDSQDPFKILASIAPSDEYPEGRVLGWKSPVYREKRGWRGWIPVEHGDEIAGENDQFLSNYIPDPPDRMIGPDALDNYVRRGDMVLSWIDARIWNTRQQKRELLARKRSVQAGSAKTEVLRDGVEIVGKGATKSSNPRKEFTIPAPAPTYVTPDGNANAARTEFPVLRKEDDKE